ncbi:inhibitor of apoptosis-promoting Bax1-domain-containing protein [Chytriomyces cf. hyalinus JEL632]|nr:inhibitor of apoptosis-promoting Bax1-domain-containing protein [Chytriomyces cf. hyalinus JEL632]
MSSAYTPILTEEAAPPPAYGAADAERTPLINAGKPFLSECEAHVKLNFMRKVYSILAAQFGLTTIVSALFMYNQDIKHVVQANPWAMFVSSFGGLALLVALIFYRSKEPANRYLLAAFTLVESYSIGVVCTFYESEVVLQAVILTFAVFIGLTLFTLNSRMSFEGMGPFLFGSLWILIFASFLQIFFPFSRVTDLIIAVFSAIIFCGYIVYDTYMIFTRMTVDDYIMASVELYLDVINLFLAILRILGGNGRDD